MNMKDFSNLVGLSAHTLRYYEKIGLLRNIQRNSSGHRIYSSHDRVWIEFVKRLKDTGMPLENILIYADLRQRGPESVLERQALLEQHKANLSLRIAEQQSHLAALEEKIDLYKNGKVH
ncbi:MAG: MerR family transcriptional regulator [Vibrio sp.]